MKERVSMYRERTIWNLFRQFVTIGLQSFGGGATTLYLMRRVSVDEQHWVSDTEYTAFWGMVQIAPGINLLGQSVLIGHKVAGLRGSLIALAGLLLPSTALTVAITAAYAVIRTNPLVMAAVHAIIPATVGIGWVLAYQMLSPVLQASRSEGVRSLVLSSVVVIAAPVFFIVVGVPAVIVLWGAGVWCAMGAIWMRRGAV
jgi:chromate transporter